MANIEFRGKAFLSKSYLDAQGGKTISLQFSATQSVELAKLELMSRNLTTFEPVLLEVTVKVSPKQAYEKNTGKRETGRGRKKECGPSIR